MILMKPTTSTQMMTQWQFEFHFQKNVDFVINVTFSRKNAKIRQENFSKLCKGKKDKNTICI